MAWSKPSPNDSSCRHTGHAMPATGWSNKFPNDSSCRPDGHNTPCTGTCHSASIVRCLSPRGHPTDSRVHSASPPLSDKDSTNLQSSTTALCGRSFIGSVHVRRSARKGGTQLDGKRSDLSSLRDEASSPGVAVALRLRGVSRVTRT
ncbi:unnamed protein product [Ectocarpus sp. 4 AP-2014]